MESLLVKVEVLQFLFFLNIYIVKDRKSTRLNSSHANISYAVFCLKKKKHISVHLTYLPIRLHLPPLDSLSLHVTHPSTLLSDLL